MKSIGLRELKDHLSEVIEAVERGEVMEITKRGRTVARVIPTTRYVSIQDRRAIIDSLDSLAAEIGKHTQPSSIAETIGEIRRQQHPRSISTPKAAAMLWVHYIHPTIQERGIEYIQYLF